MSEFDENDVALIIRVALLSTVAQVSSLVQVLAVANDVFRLQKSVCCCLESILAPKSMALETVFLHLHLLVHLVDLASSAYKKSFQDMVQVSDQMCSHLQFSGLMVVESWSSISCL